MSEDLPGNLLRSPLPAREADISLARFAASTGLVFVRMDPEERHSAEAVPAGVRRP